MGFRVSGMSVVLCALCLTRDLHAEQTWAFSEAILSVVSSMKAGPQYLPALWATIPIGP